MNTPRISADWSTTKPIAAFSCTPCLQEVHTKAEVVQLTPGLLGLVVHSIVICTRGVQENAAIGLVVLQSAEILVLIICFALQFDN